MSDNGSVPNIPGAKKYEKSYNHPLSRGKWDAFEGGIRIPFVIAGPGIKDGSESAAPVSGSDLLPTIIDLAGNHDTVDFHRTRVTEGHAGKGQFLIGRERVLLLSPFQ